MPINVPRTGRIAPKQTLANATQGSPGLPPKIVAYGRPAVGKTSFGAQSSAAPLFLLSPQETGLHTLIDARTAPASIASIEIADWPTLLSVAAELAATDHPYKSVVVDTLGGMETLACAVVMARSYDNDTGKFMNFHQGFKSVAQTEWKKFLIALDAIARKGIPVICLAHAEATGEKNPLGADYTHMTPACSKPVWKDTFAWADVVAFLDFDFSTAVFKQGEKSKGVGGERRIMRTKWSPAYDAKSRFSIPDELPMGTSGREAWGNLQNAISESKK